MPSRTFSMLLLIAVTCLGHYTATETVNASAGERVALPCEIPTHLIQKEPLFWWRNAVEIICELTMEKVTIYESFKGRAEVSEEKLKDRDCTLILHNVNESDSGEYKFYNLGQKQEPILHMDLLVKAKDPTEGLTTAHQDLLQQNRGTSSAPDGQHSSGGIIAGSVGAVAIVVIVVILAVLGICIYLCKRKTGRTPGGADSDQDNGASIPLNNLKLKTPRRGCDPSLMCVQCTGHPEDLDEEERRKTK